MFYSDVSGENVGGQLKVFERVEGNVSVVDDGKDHRDVSALKGQLLDGSQVGNRAVETAHTHAGVRFPRVALLEFGHRVGLINIKTNPPLVRAL